VGVCDGKPLRRGVEAPFAQSNARFSMTSGEFVQKRTRRGRRLCQYKSRREVVQRSGCDADGNNMSAAREWISGHEVAERRARAQIDQTVALN